MWRSVNIACILAATIQLACVLKQFLVPEQTNTSLENINLEDIKFPLVFKICSQPGFNVSAIREAGYGHRTIKNDVANYFFGQSKFNFSIVGWAGHQNGSFVVENDVAEVFERVRSHKPSDIVKEITLILRSGNSKNISVEEVYLSRVNFPNNCYTLDLSDDPDVNTEGLKMVTFVLRRQGTSTFVFLKGKSMNSDRDISDHVFHRTYIELESKITKKYSVEISKNIFVEDDSSKNCRKYPNKKYASYNDCDERYMKNMCDQDGLIPIWLTNDFEKVTKEKTIMKSGRIWGSMRFIDYFRSPSQMRHFLQWE